MTSVQWTDCGHDSAAYPGKVPCPYCLQEKLQTAEARYREKAGELADMIDQFHAREEELENRVIDAEAALKIWDGTRSSEYWERYPEKMAEELS